MACDIRCVLSNFLIAFLAMVAVAAALVDFFDLVEDVFLAGVFFLDLPLLLLLLLFFSFLTLAFVLLLLLPPLDSFFTFFFFGEGDDDDS